MNPTQALDGEQSHFRPGVFSTCCTSLFCSVLLLSFHIFECGVEHIHGPPQSRQNSADPGQSPCGGPQLFDGSHTSSFPSVEGRQHLVDHVLGDAKRYHLGFPHLHHRDLYGASYSRYPSSSFSLPEIHSDPKGRCCVQRRRELCLPLWSGSNCGHQHIVDVDLKLHRTWVHDAL